MIQDIHIHIRNGRSDDARTFLGKKSLAEITGGSIFSLPPASYRPAPDNNQRWQSRLEWVLQFTQKAAGFKPFLFLDPLASDAEKQIHTAAAKGISGF